MKGLRIYIPTYRRMDAQRTWGCLTDALRKRTVLVAGGDEAAQHVRRGRRVLCCPEQGKGIARVRQWILEHAASEGREKFLVFDDDLAFGYRTPEALHVVKCSDEQVEAAVKWMWDALDTHAHCTLEGRFLNSYERGLGAAAPFSREVGRAVGNVGYRTADLLRVGASFLPDGWDGTPFMMEDYMMTLRLLSAGLPNLICMQYRGEPQGTNAAGGCSGVRTAEVMEYQSRLLEAMFPHCVKAVRKKTKTTWGGLERWDVKISWKKAYHASGVRE